MTTESPNTQAGSRFTNFLKRRWLAISIVVVAIAVAAQNALSDEESTVLLLWVRLTLPSWLLIMIVFLIGCVVGWLAVRGRSRRRKR